jgi:nucleoside-diphosphate-sugar epimerase
MHSEKAFCTEYEKSKVLADKIALQAAAEGVPVTIVYPGVMYGPGKLTTGNLVSRIVRELSSTLYAKCLLIVLKLFEPYITRIPTCSLL